MLTYGDPRFYGRLGFEPVTEADFPAPFALRHPEGWQGQSLTRAPLVPIRAPAHCVSAFDDPDLW